MQLEEPSNTNPPRTNIYTKAERCSMRIHHILSRLILLLCIICFFQFPFSSSLMHAQRRVTEKDIRNAGTTLSDIDIHEAFVEIIIQGLRTGRITKLLDLFKDGVMEKNEHYTREGIKNILTSFSSTQVNQKNKMVDEHQFTRHEVITKNVNIEINSNTGNISFDIHFLQPIEGEDHIASIYRVVLLTTKVGRTWYIDETKGLMEFLIANHRRGGK